MDERKDFNIIKDLEKRGLIKPEEIIVERKASMNSEDYG